MTLVSFLSLSCVAHAAPPVSPTPAPPQMARSLTVTESLKAAVAQAEEKLGTLEPWQKKIYEDEIIPQAQRFVRDFRHSSNGLTVDVDQDLLRKYLAFFAPKALKRPDLRLLTYVRVDPACAKCVRAEAELKGLARNRAERRGFTPVWVTEDELKQGQPAEVVLTGKDLSDRLAAMAVKQNFAGALLLEARVAPVDTSDTAHADEEHYQMLASMLARPEGQTEYRHQGVVDFLANDPVEPAAQRLLNDALTIFGRKALLATQNDDFKAVEEISLTVRGVKDYAQYQKLKAQLQSGLKDGVAVEERRISRGQVVFGVRGGRSPASVREQVGAVSFDGSKLTVISTTGDNPAGTQIEAELR